MKGTEFRLNNYLHDREGRLCQVAKLQNEFDDEDQIFAPSGTGITSYPHKPIPLTEEWLLKFGFEETQSCYKKSGLKFPFSALNNGSIANYCTINNVPINISKVHKLQNLFFALTGEELKLK